MVLFAFKKYASDSNLLGDVKRVSGNPFRARKSKLDSFIDIVGVESDAVVAVKASVSTEAVRSFRARRGIPALWRGETEQPAAPAPRMRRAEKAAFRGRRSRVEPYAHLLGERPDKDVAAMAGVTVQNVRAYRLRRGIELSSSSPPTSLSHVRALFATASSDDAARVPSSEPNQWAYLVTVQIGAEEKDFVVFGESLSDAAKTAERRIAERIPHARVLEIATVAEAL